MLDARAGFDCTVAMMKTKIFALLAGVVVIAATGCVSTVSGTKSPAIWFGRDTVSGRYERSLDQVYQAAVAAITTDGVIITEYVPHDTTNSTRALYGRGLAKIRKGDRNGAATDINAAKAIRSDIAEEFGRYGLKP